MQGRTAVRPYENPHFDTESAVAYTSFGAQVIDVDGTLDGGDVVPGLKIALRTLFPK